MTDFSEPGPEPSPQVEPAGAPDLARMERLDGRVVPYWIVSGLFGVLVLAALAFGGIAVFGAQVPEHQGTLFTVAAVAVGVLVAVQLIVPPLAWGRWRFTIDDELLVARYGVIFHEEKAIPVSRLQHVDLTRGPIERLFGLATLVVHTAGTEGAAFRLPGLAAARAAEIRDGILEARGDDVV